MQTFNLISMWYLSTNITDESMSFQVLNFLFQVLWELKRPFPIGGFTEGDFIVVTYIGGNLQALDIKYVGIFLIPGPVKGKNPI